MPWMHTTSSLFFIFTIASLTPTLNAIFGPKMSHLPALGFRPGRCYQPNLLGINYKWPFWKKRCSCLIKQGNYSLRRPPKLIIPKIFTKQRWATVYRFMCNRICKSKQAYMTRAKVMSSLRDKINQKLLTFKRTPSP